jgi:hypothetical protein
MPGPHQIPAGVLAGPQQIPGGLLGLGGHPNPGQLADAQQPRQPLRVAPAGFDLVSGRALEPISRLSLQTATARWAFPS